MTVEIAEEERTGSIGNGKEKNKTEKKIPLGSKYN